jgi:hypothetical protein
MLMSTDPNDINFHYGGRPILYVHGHRGDYQQIAHVVGQVGINTHFGCGNTAMSNFASLLSALDIFFLIFHLSLFCV